MARGWNWLSGFQASGQAGKGKSDFEQAREVGEADEGVRVALLKESPVFTADGHPEFPRGELAFQGQESAAAFGNGRIPVFIWFRKWCVGRKAINFVEDGFPLAPPFQFFSARGGFAVHHGIIEEARSEFCQSAMGADGAGESGQGAQEMVGTARSHEHARGIV